MKKAVSILPVLAALSVASGCAPIEQIAGSPHDIEYCRMESTIGSHVKEVVCDPNTTSPNSDVGLDANGIFGDISAEQTARSSQNWPTIVCRPR